VNGRSGSILPKKGYLRATSPASDQWMNNKGKRIIQPLISRVGIFVDEVARHF
jgi:hypothetical protein